MAVYRGKCEGCGKVKMLISVDGKRLCGKCQPGGRAPVPKNQVEKDSATALGTGQGEPCGFRQRQAGGS
jgi:hypothetical protein